jgi:hypothetical protein
VRFWLNAVEARIRIARNMRRIVLGTDRLT